MVTTIAAQLIASIAYAHVNPSALITSPPRAGPMTIVSVPSPYSSASAPRSWRRSTEVRHDRRRLTTFSRDTNAASTAASAYSTATGGMSDPRRHREPRRRQHEPDWSSSRSFRRSNRSAIAPPRSAAATSGASSTAPRSPTSSARPRLDVHLVGQRDKRRLRAEARQETPDYHEPEVAARRAAVRDRVSAAGGANDG